MCGIAGAIAFDGKPVSERLLTDMRDAMAHRGPDGAEVWMSPDRRVGLAHRRLSIVDLSTIANQPMGNEDGAIQVVFNGEIYNHADIRAELVRIGGHTWKTDHSDTEVILHAFEQWGMGCLDRFRGMFAFGLWDGRNRELWLVRDRIGIKPLYYSVHHGRLTFASEIKALLRDPDQRRAVDEEALFHYLSFITTPAPTTLFEGIKKLPAGHLLRVRANGDVEERRWWDLWEHVHANRESEDAIAHRLLDELRTAVSLRKMSDVPVGVFLSGGIDSSTNVALFSEGETRPVQTFSVAWQGDPKSNPSELPYAREVAKRFGAHHHERVLTQDDLLGFLPRMVELQDEPIADPVCVPLYYVSKLARDNGVIVCQVGEGSDELFWGYTNWRRLLVAQRVADRSPTPLLRLGLRGLRAIGQGDSMPYEFVRRAALHQPIAWGIEGFTDRQKHRLLSDRLRRRFGGLTSWDALAPIRKRFEEGAWEKTHVNWMTWLDLQLRLPELLLMRVDKMSMGVSLEARVPFLDHRFVEFAMGIPESVKTRRMVSKYILKKAVRGLIPDAIIDRKKQGFDVPVYEWISGRLGDRVRQDVAQFCDATDYVDKREAMSYLDHPRAKLPWFLLNLAMWWKTYLA